MKKRGNKGFRGSKEIVEAPKSRVKAVFTGLQGYGLEQLMSFLSGCCKGPIQSCNASVSAGLSVCDPAMVDAILSREAQPKIYAVYEAPWVGAMRTVQDDADYLADWQAFGAALLRLRQEHPSRVVLLNVERLWDSNELLVAELAGAGACKRENDDCPDSSRAAASAVAPLYGHAFALAAPEYWELYEALESCAWLGTAEPQFRDKLTADSGNLSLLIAQGRAADSLPKLLQASQVEIETLRSAQEKSDHISTALQQTIDGLRNDLSSSEARHHDEVGRMQLQLAQVHAGIEEAELRNLEQQRELTELQAKCERAEEENRALAQSQHSQIQAAAQKESEWRAALRQAEASACDERTTLETTIRSLTTEVEARGQAHRHQVQVARARQAELEAGVVEAQEKLSKLENGLMQATAALASTKDALQKREAELKTLQSDFKRTANDAAQAERKHREVVQELEKRRKDTQAEADLLLLQLKQVQEELEHYFHKSRDAALALEQSAETFRRARQVVTGLASVNQE